MAAVIGQDVPLVVWARVAEVDEDRLLELAEQGEEARLLVETADGEGVRFSHALIREALHDGLSSLRRRRLHQRVGEALAAVTSSPPDPDVVAYHFLWAGDARATEWLIQAGERAQRAYAWVTAVGRFDMALAQMTEQDTPVVDRGVLLFRIAFLLRFIDERRALRSAEEARSLALGIGEAGLAASCLHLAGLLRCFLGDPRQGINALEQAVTEFRILSPTEHARLWALIGADLGPPEGTLTLWLAIVGRFEEARASAHRMRAETLSPPLEAGQGDSWYGDGIWGLALAEAPLGHLTAARSAFDLARSDLPKDRTPWPGCRLLHVGDRTLAIAVLCRRA